MYYFIKFKDKNRMWHFIEKHVVGNYSASNSSLIIELSEKDYKKAETVEKAKEYGGELVN